MTEDLEKKLNELLDLKKELREATEERKSAAMASAVDGYKRSIRHNTMRFAIVLAVGVVVFVLGVTAMYRVPVVQIDPMSLILIGLLIMVPAKLGWLIRMAKLSILMEMKQFEGRLMELLKK